MAAIYTTNIIIYTHTDLEQTFILEDTASTSALNLTGYSGSAQFRRYKSSSVSGTFDVQITDPLSGAIKIELDYEKTKNLSPGKYFYDVNITSPAGEKTRVVEGTVLVKKAVTR